MISHQMSTGSSNLIEQIIGLLREERRVLPDEETSDARPFFGRMRHEAFPGTRLRIALSCHFLIFIRSLFHSM
jgi:hypothetical protein